jgi:Yip1 domain
MSDPNQEFQPPPPPTIEGEIERKRPANLLWAGVALVVLGIVVLVGGIVGFISGGIGTGAAVCLLGVLFFGLSFVSLPYVPDAPPPMSTVGRLTGIFFEPTNVFRNLRAHPHWLAAILIMGCLNAAYVTAFYHRLTPERIINFTMDKLEESPIKPPPEAMAKARTQGVEQEKSTAYQVGKVVKTVVAAFFGIAFIAVLYLLGVLAFGGRMHFWQAYAVTAFAAFPVLVIQRVISFIVLFLKSPDSPDIHPIIGQETLVTDNLGILFKAADHPVLYVTASAIGILSFYKLWLTAKGLHEGGYKVSSSAGWGVAITLWVLGLLLGLAVAAIFPGFFS